MIRRLSITFLALLWCEFVAGQNKNIVAEFGIGTSALVSSDNLSFETVNFFDNGVNLSYAPRISQDINASIRFELKNRFSLETGITQRRRNYDFSISPNQNFKYEQKMRISSFEIPILLWLHVPTGEMSAMGINFGLGSDLYPGNTSIGKDSFLVYSYVAKRFKANLKAGFAYEKYLNAGGKLQFGFGYTRMLGKLSKVFMDYSPSINDNQALVNFELKGHLFSASIKYYFNP